MPASQRLRGPAVLRKAPPGRDGSRARCGDLAWRAVSRDYGLVPERARLRQGRRWPAWEATDLIRPSRSPAPRASSTEERLCRGDDRMPPGRAELNWIDTRQVFRSLLA